MKEQQERDPEHDIGDHERTQQQRRRGRLAGEPAPDERDRGEHAEHDGAEAGKRRDDPARHQRGPEIRVGGELAVPVERKPAERERRDLRVVEREDQEDHDRRVQEDDDEGEEHPHRPGAVSRERDVHQSVATCRGWRNRAKTTVSTVTTTSRNIASTEPVSQSGKPVPNRSTIWLPYMYPVAPPTSDGVM